MVSEHYSFPWLLILSVCFSVNLVALYEVRKLYAKLSAEHERMGDLMMCVFYLESRAV